MSAGHYAARIAPSPHPLFWKYAGWQHGENSFAEDNEIKSDEFYDGVNIELQGKASIRMPRRGHRLFSTISGKTNFNGWGVYKDPINSTNVLIVQIDGHVYSVSTAGTVTEIDNTKTWDTSAKMRGVLLRGFFYFGNAVDYMAKTDGSTITRWLTTTTPTGVGVVKTGTGTDTAYGYGVTAVTDVGETEVSALVTIFGNGTLDSSNYLSITWDRNTATQVQGYNIYKSVKGGTYTQLTFISQPTSGATVTFADKGTIQKSLIFEAPTFNTTGGIKGNIFAKYANTLFVCGNLQQPDTVFYGGTGAQWESFSPSSNGGWVKVGRGDGERCTGMFGFEDFLFIFKENSIWKFVFGGDGGPTLTAVIPQYGTSSPDTIWRMEKDIIYLGTDLRYRILGFEPTQLNVIRTTDISNRIQNRLDVLDTTNLDNFFGTFFEQKYIVGNKSTAYPYDRRYLGFLGKWTNYLFDRFIVWDAGSNKQKLFGFETGTGKIHQLLVDSTYDDNGVSISAYARFKRVDAGEDTVLKYYYFTKTKLRNPRGTLQFTTFKDGSNLVDTTDVTYDVGGGIDEFMFDEAMFDESVAITVTSDAFQILKKILEFEAYSIYHQISVNGDSNNHCIIQTMGGKYEIESEDYERDEKII